MTKALSGETLSLVLDYLRQANAGAIGGPACGQLIAAVLAKDGAYVELQGRSKRPASVWKGTREHAIDPSSLARLNAMLPWASYNALQGADRFLGTAWTANKRSVAQPMPDTTVERLNKVLPLNGLSILEAGCFEGHHTASLAQYSSDLWAFDGRIENVIKTLVRLWVFGVEHSVTLEHIDIEVDRIGARLARRGRLEKFELVHHRGVLYHLSRPVEHLVDISALCAQHIYLHTQIATEAQVNGIHRSDVGEFEVFSYKESGRSYSPFAGITDKALWLTKASLVRVLQRLGFPNVMVLNETKERNGDRVELIASRR